MIKITRAFRLDEYPQLAFVGAGGKSGSIFRLASQHDGPCLITTTTHLGKDQSKLADSHIIVQSLSDIKSLELPVEKSSLLVTGPLVVKHRWSALDAEAIQALSKIARSNAMPLLIEADGANQRILKTPAEHEPAIPDFVDQVVLVAGLSALGRPLSSKIVHRPKLFAELANMKMGEEISISHLIQVLTHAQGGRKSIPQDARRLVLLNHVDNRALESASREMAEPLLQDFHAVISASLQHQSDPIRAVYERSVGIILAAGESARFGDVKALENWQGKTFIKGISHTAMASRLHEIHLILGAHYEQIAREIKDLDLFTHRNKSWRSGQSSSVKMAISSLPRHVGSALFMLVDQPQLSQTLIQALLDAHSSSQDSIIAPQIDGQRGTPVLFDRRTFHQFSALEGDVGGRALFSKHRVQWLQWLDASQAIDVDTPADLIRLKNYL